MDLLEGLNAKQIGMIRHCLASREFGKHEIVFREGDPAESFFIILRGRVEVLRETDGRPVRLAKLGAGDAFGEMGILIGAGRTAAVRALEPTLAYEIPSTLVQSMRAACGAEATLKFLENLVCVLAERLRGSRERGATPGSLVLLKTLTVAAEMEQALKLLRRCLPKGPTRWLAPKKRLKPGEHLLRQGDPSDGFHFIHRGTLEVIREDGSGGPRVTGALAAPIIAGEYGFFTGERRTASLRAADEVVQTHFPAAHFLRLKERYPAEALEVLFAIARLAAYLMAGMNAGPDSAKSGVG